MPVFTMTQNRVDGDTLAASDLNSMKSSTETFLNSTKIDSTNIQTGGIATANYGAASVDTAALGSGAVTAAKLDSAVQYALVPTGSVLPYIAATAPNGFLVCNGAAVSRTTYAALFNLIGVKFGYGDNATTFNLPDMRGMFMRGYDNGAGIDPNAASRTAAATGGATGDNIGSKQTHAFQGLEHNANLNTTTAQAGAGSSSVYSQTGTFSGVVTTPTSMSGSGTVSYSSETRPTNLSFQYIIKT